EAGDLCVPSRSAARTARPEWRYAIAPRQAQLVWERFAGPNCRETGCRPRRSWLRGDRRGPQRYSKILGGRLPKQYRALARLCQDRRREHVARRESGVPGEGEAELIPTNR